MTSAPRACGGQAAIEYLLVSAALVLALGLGRSGVLQSLHEGLSTHYQRFLYTLALP